MFVTQHTVLNYRNERGMVVTLAPLAALCLQKCEEEAENEINSDKQSGVHGEVFGSSSLGIRSIVLTGTLNSPGGIEYLKSILEKTFNPTIPGVLTHSNTKTDTHRMIDCHVSRVAKVYWDKDVARFDIELKCLMPFWRAAEKIEVIALLTKKLVFPLVIPPKSQGGFVFGSRKRTLESRFDNVGDVDTGFRTMLYARNGSVVNPWVENMVTGEKVKLLYTMQKGEFIEIFNYPYLKKVVVNGAVNGFRHIDTDNAKFFVLPVGDNIVGYNAEENPSNLEVIVYYIPLYLGAC